MRTVTIVQARMSSTRLPGKVMMDLCGRPMLAQLISRLRRCQLSNDIVVATTQNPADDDIVSLCRIEGVRWFRGSEYDVLSRYAGAARECQADTIVRVASDCPLIDPEETDRVVRALADDEADYDYASNALELSFPRGLDAEAFFLDTLLRTARMARSAAAREHVTYFIYQERPELFRLCSVRDTQNNADLRWTIDAPEDLELVRRLYTDLDLGERVVGYRDLLAHVRAHPELAVINAGVMQRAS